jgi:maltose O-acetyltransferase
LDPITVGHPLTPKARRQHLANAKPIHIGDDVWIGRNFTVAAGAVVTKDIPDNTLVAGVPAKKIRDLENNI